MFGNNICYDQQVGMTLAQIAYAPAAKIAALLAEPGHAGGGEWRLQWLGEGDGHLLYVCRHPSSGQLAVVIRGSVGNPLSEAFWRDWIGEDLDVLRQAPLPFAAGCRVSQGALRGLDALLALRDQNAGTTLMTYLTRQFVPEPSGLTVLGHSLGGGLASLLALYLYERLCTPLGAPSSCIVPISFAAPTAGNASFAGRLEALFDGYTRRYVNDLDMVPHTWSADGLAWIKDSYSRGPSIPAWFHWTTEKVGAYLNRHGRDYEHPGSGVAAAGALSDAGDHGGWFAQVAHQHAGSTYLQLYGAPPLAEAF